MGEEHRFVGIGYMAIANACSDIYQLDKALTLYQKALNIYKLQKSPTSSTGRALNNIGLIYRKLENYKQAISYFNLALDIYKNFDDEVTIYSQYLTYFNKAEVYFEQDSLALARFYYNKVKDFQELYYQNSSDLGDSYNSIGQVLLDETKIELC